MSNKHDDLKQAGAIREPSELEEWGRLADEVIVLDQKSDDGGVISADDYETYTDFRYMAAPTIKKLLSMLKTAEESADLHKKNAQQKFNSVVELASQLKSLISDNERLQGELSRAGKAASDWMELYLEYKFKYVDSALKLERVESLPDKWERERNRSHTEERIRLGCSVQLREAIKDKQ